jgi:plastocyanin
VALALVFATSAQAATGVDVFNNGYNPTPVAVAPGDTVQWTWSGQNHSVTSDGGSAESYSSGIRSSGGSSFSHTFNTPGSFTYHCVVHSSMHGTVNVTVITGRVVADSDASNSVTAADDGLDAVTVELHDAGNPADPPVDTTTTDANGRYSFPNPAPGSYTVHVPDQPGFDHGTDVAAFQVTSTNSNDGKDVLFKGIGTVSGTVWNDLNGNGAHDSPEAGKGGATVSLNGKRSTISASDGTYSFANAVPGAGTVSVTAPSGFSVAGNASRPIDLHSPDFQALDQDFFVVQQASGSISGSVREDLNGSGTLDAGEGGVGGVVIGLDTNGDQAADTTATTNGEGAYSFGNLTSRNYRVILSVPDGYQNTGPAAIEIGVAAGQDSSLPPFLIRKPPPAATADATKATGGDDLLNGTAKGDKISGLGGDDVIFGLGGNDLLDGGAGNDKIDGGKGNDTLKGGAGNDSLTGGDGNDVLVGGAGKDKLNGGRGSDKLTGNGGKDSLVGGPGNDSINAKDGVAETVKCGPGRDKVKADRKDKLSGCEKRT